MRRGGNPRRAGLADPIRRLRVRRRGGDRLPAPRPCAAGDGRLRPGRRRASPRRVRPPRPAGLARRAAGPAAPAEPAPGARLGVQAGGGLGGARQRCHGSGEPAGPRRAAGRPEPAHGVRCWWRAPAGRHQRDAPVHGDRAGGAARQPHREPDGGRVNLGRAHARRRRRPAESSRRPSSSRTSRWSSRSRTSGRSSRH